MSAAPPSDLVSEWTGQAAAADGASLCIRPLRADDRQREIAFINSLSDETRYLRLHAPLRFLSPHLIDQLMDIDYHRRMAFVATVMNDGVEEFVGLARYGETDDPGTVELGITVTDAWQRRGVARLLLEQLIRYARWRGFTRMCGFVLPENMRMLEFAHSLGFTARFSSAERLTHITRSLI
jgi:GNAT superfamily N-acetyltransferase